MPKPNPCLPPNALTMCRAMNLHPCRALMMMTTCLQPLLSVCEGTAWATCHAAAAPPPAPALEWGVGGGKGAGGGKGQVGGGGQGLKGWGGHGNKKRAAGAWVAGKGAQGIGGVRIQLGHGVGEVLQGQGCMGCKGRVQRTEGVWLARGQD